MLTIEILLTIITLVSLLVASYQDIQTRSVHDGVWLVQIVLSLLLLLIYIFAVEPLSFAIAVTFGLNISFAILLAIVSYIFGLFGAGDSLAIIALGISIPWIFSFIPRIPTAFVFFPPIPLIIFNMIFGVFAVILFIFGRNIRNYSKFGGWFNESRFSVLAKLRLLITCTQVPVTSITAQQFADPAEIYENEQWHVYLPTSMESGELCELQTKEERQRQLCQQNATITNRSYLWMRPQIPGLPIFLFAFILFLCGCNFFLSFLRIML